MRLALLSFLCLWMICPAVADTYTIDQRQYVSRDAAPYSSIVRLGGDDPYCTGILTANGIVITAKHCVLDKNNMIMSHRDIRADHATYGALLLGMEPVTGATELFPGGNFDFSAGLVGDWAFLSPRMDVISDINVARFSGNAPVDVLVAGYGALKILSDQEIQNLRRAYMEYLRDNSFLGAINPMYYFGGEDIHSNSATGLGFIWAVTQGKIPDVSPDVFRDNNALKVSHCQAQSVLDENAANLLGCQGWGGNSGGPVFLNLDGKWYLYGISFAGRATLSNDRNTHAESANMVYVNHFWDQYVQFLDRHRENHKQREIQVQQLKKLLSES